MGAGALAVPPAATGTPALSAVASIATAAAGTAPGAAVVTAPAMHGQTIAPPGAVAPPSAVAPLGLGVALLPAGGGSAAADLRQIALFVSKWRLEPSRTKALLANLTPPRRRFVMQSFKDASGATGAAPVVKLEEYIAQCEQTNAWAAAEA